jgi:Gpi18-like mannosyltransferase
MARATDRQRVATPTYLDAPDVRGVVRRWRSRASDELLLLAGASATAFALRLTLFGARNNDVNNHFFWLHTIRDQGFHAFATGFSGYTPLYPYYLWIANAILHPHVRDEAILKLAPILFDFVLAFFVYKLVRLRHPRGLMPAYAYLAVLFAPTVCLNAAYWGQIDSIWTSGVVACVYFLLTRRELPAFLAFAFAFVVKVQSVFLLPFLVALALKGKVAWRSFLLLPAAYLLMITPAAIAGRPVGDLLTIYVSQSDEYKDLTLYAANVYEWVPSGAHQLSRPALIWGFAVIAALLLALAARLRELTSAQIVACATASVLVVPFVLPHMHDRYFFTADVLSIVLAFYVAQGYLIALAVQLASFFQYGPFLFGYTAISFHVIALGLLVTIVVLLRAIARSLAQPDGELLLFPRRSSVAARDLGP